MYMVLTIAVIVIAIGALIGTLFVGKEVDKTIKTLEKIEDREEHDKLLKANHFKSVRANVRVLVLIYALTFLLAIIAFLIYIWLK